MMEKRISLLKRVPLLKLSSIRYLPFIAALMLLIGTTVLLSGCGSGGSSGPTSLPPSSTSPSVSPAITSTISLSAASTGAGTFSPNGLYFYASTGNGVDVINTITGTLVTTLPVSGTPNGPVTFAGTSYEYVESTNSDIYSINPLTNSISSPVSTTAVSEGKFPATKHTDWGYTIWGWNNKLSVINLPSLTVSKTISPIDSSIKYPQNPKLFTSINPVYQYGYIAQNGSGDIFIVDLNPSSPTFGTIVKTIPAIVGGAQVYGPCDTAVSSNGSYLYTPICSAIAGQPAISTGSILVIDVNPSSSSYGQIIQTVDAPTGFITPKATLSPNDQYLAVEGASAELYYTVDPFTGLITNPTAPANLTSIANGNSDEFTPGSNRDFVINGSDVYVVNMTIGGLFSPTVSSTKIALSSPAISVGAFSPNGLYFYVNTNDGVDVINTLTGTLVTTLPVSGAPNGPVTFSGPSDIYVQTKVSATASDIYAINPLTNTIGSPSPTTAVEGNYPSNKHTDGGYTIWGWANKLSVISLPSLTVSKTINAVDPSMAYPTDPGEWTAVNPIYPYGYVALRGAGNIFVVDLNPSSSTYGTVIKTIPTVVSGTQIYGPCDATISSNGKYFYTVIFGDTGAGEASVSPGYVLVVDVNPNSSRYGQIIQQVDAPSGFTTIMATLSPDNQYLAIEGGGGELYYTVDPSTGLITNPTSPYELTSLAGAATDEFTPGSNRDYVMDGSKLYVVNMAN